VQLCPDVSPLVIKQFAYYYSGSTGQHYTTIKMSDCYTFNWKKVIFILLEKLNTSGGYFFSPDQNLVLSWDKINGDHRVFFMGSPN